ncbi:MAG: hypothetical protein JWP25_730 [Bradyrhizobium sp.]|jgi:hypothetical protein|nr:hypothetical protein [Bradyrhizobium sp.]
MAYWIPAFAGMTEASVVRAVSEVSSAAQIF